MRLWPRSLLGRNLVLLTGLTVASQLCALVIFVFFIQRPRIDAAASFEAAQIVAVGRLLAALPPAERQRQLGAMNGSAQAPDRTAAPFAAGGTYVMRRYVARLRAQLPSGASVHVDGGASPGRLWVRFADARDSYWMLLPAPPSTGDFLVGSTLLLLLSQTLLPMLAAYLIHRRTQRALACLARAAGSVERGAWPQPVPLDGPLELATVADAFNRMVQALSEVEAGRTAMLAGISHDIRTPLTKLRMAVTAPEAFEAPQASAERFIDEIDAVLGQFIDFARGGDGERPLRGDLNDLIEQLAGGYASIGHPFVLALAPLPPLYYRPIGVQRVLMNLMQNALLHGGSGLAVRSWIDGAVVVVAVEDRGPGLQADQLEAMKQPFRRGSGGSGTGLGLAIAERIARQGGGTLALEARHGGGLRALLRLPMADRDADSPAPQH